MLFSAKITALSFLACFALASSQLFIDINHKTLFIGFTILAIPIITRTIQEHFIPKRIKSFPIDRSDSHWNYLVEQDTEFTKKLAILLKGKIPLYNTISMKDLVFQNMQYHFTDTLYDHIKILNTVKEYLESSPVPFCVENVYIYPGLYSNTLQFSWKDKSDLTKFKSAVLGR